MPPGIRAWHPHCPGGQPPSQAINPPAPVQLRIPREKTPTLPAYLVGTGSTQVQGACSRQPSTHRHRPPLSSSRVACAQMSELDISRSSPGTGSHTPAYSVQVKHTVLQDGISPTNRSSPCNRCTNAFTARTFCPTPYCITPKVHYGPEAESLTYSGYRRERVG